VVEAGRWTDTDDLALEWVQRARVPVALAVSKVDRLRPRSRMLPFLAATVRRADFRFVVPLSARTGENVGALLDELAAALPEGPVLFPEDRVTDRSERFLAAELIREQLMNMLHQEVPYGLTVEIERFEEPDVERVRIGAVIWVAREGHKAIVIGRGGDALKRIGRAARLQIAEALGRRVHLDLWVKVREGWTDRPGAVQEFGYE